MNIQKISRTLLCIALMAIITSTTAAAQKYKVIERSSKKQPSWVNSTEQGFIITTSVSTDIETAKRQCLSQVKSQIIEAVAQNITSSSRTATDQQISSDQTVENIELFSSMIETQSGNFPYISGISLSRAADSYWELRRDRKTKEQTYFFALKYPFARIEMEMLIDEYNRMDSEKWSQFRKMYEDYDNIESVEQIGSTISDLAALRTYFFDQHRKEQVTALQQKYYKLYDQITVNTIEEELGKATVVITLNNREIKSGTRPIMKSETAAKLQYGTTAEGRHVVAYQYDHMEDGEVGEILLSYRFGTRNFTHKIYFKMEDSSPQIIVRNDVVMTAEAVADGNIADVNVRMNIMAENCKTATIQSVTLTIPGVGSMTFDDVNAKFTAADGVYELKLKSASTHTVTRGTEGRNELLRGTMLMKFDNSKRSESINFSAMFRANW